MPGSKDALAISDVVLGSAEDGVPWNSRQMYQLTFQLFRAEDADDIKPPLSIVFPQPFSDVLVAVQHTAGLNRLDPDSYRVKVTIAGGGESPFAMTVLTVMKQ